MFTLSSSTSPWTLAPGVSSCIRFRQRSRVLLPHPDGPMIAVTIWAGNKSETSRTARCWPNSAVRCAASRRSRVLADATIALPRDPAGGDGNDQHESHEHERGRPRQTMPFVEGARRIHVDLQRQRLHRLRDGHGEVQIAKCGEQEWGGLAGNSCDPREAPRDDSAERCARHDLERRAPARVSERERRLAQRMRHQAHHFFRRTREHRNHQNRQRDAARERRIPLRRPDDECPRHDADHDRRSAVEHIGNEPHHETEPPGPVLGEVQPGCYTDRYPDQRGETDDDARTHDRVGDTASRLPSRHGTLRKEGPIDGRRALQHEIAENEQQREHRGERQHHHHGGHRAAGEMTAEHAAAHSARLPTAWPRATRQIRTRAMALTATVSTKRINPTSNKADWYRLVVASLNSLAIAAAIVYAGCRSETPMSCRFPMSIVTAIVSPSARPRPRMTAPIKPARP